MATPAPTGVQHLDKVLQEQECGLTSLDIEVLLTSLRSFHRRAVGGITLKRVLLLNVAQVLRQRVRVNDVGASTPCKIMFIVPMM